MRITLPGVVNDFLHDMMEEYGFNKSELLEGMIFFVSQPENMEAFKAQYLLGDDVVVEDDEDDEEEDDEDVDEDDLLGEFDDGEG